MTASDNPKAGAKGGRRADTRSGARAGPGNGPEAAADTAEAEAREFVRDTQAEIKAQTEQLAEKARSAAAAYAAQGRDAGAVRVLHIGKSLRAMAEQLDTDGEPGLAAPVWRAAEEVTALADRLHRQDVGDMIEAAQDFARHRPGALFGTATVAGFLLGRFLMVPGGYGRVGRHRGSAASQGDTD
jgi:ElaB/YqjD/DUF883 family membrane-anchored ribosome-binding protein